MYNRVGFAGGWLLDRNASEKDSRLNDTLSVIVPIHNAQSSLGQQVEDCLDVLPDLTYHFEVLIVDDGSTDSTEEIAHELANQFPQVRVIRQHKPLGTDEAIKIGLEHADGSIVFVHDSGEALSARHLRELWQLRNDHELVAARPQPPVETNWLDQLIQWANRLPVSRPQSSGLQMIRRDAVRELMNEASAKRQGQEQLPPRAPTFASGLRNFTFGE